jgi:hypothetical protein
VEVLQGLQGLHPSLHLLGAAPLQQQAAEGWEVQPDDHLMVPALADQEEVEQHLFASGEEAWPIVGPPPEVVHPPAAQPAI